MTGGLPADPPGLRHVPTVPELGQQGLAEIVRQDRTGTYWRVSDEGRRLITEAMIENAETRIAWRARTRED